MVCTMVYLTDNTIIHCNTLGVDDRSAMELTFVTVDGGEGSFLLDTDDGSLDGEALAYTSGKELVTKDGLVKENVLGVEDGSELELPLSTVEGVEDGFILGTNNESLNGEMLNIEDGTDDVLMLGVPLEKLDCAEDGIIPGHIENLING